VNIRHFDSYDSYVRMQAITDRKKSARTSIRLDDVRNIKSRLELMGIGAQSIVCHGARNGEEVDWFSEVFECEAVGTDLLSRSHPGVVKWDFHDRKDEWIGRFDLVYSNSLDHSHDPPLAVGTWAEQLRPGGVLCVQWSQDHVRAVMGDCFGAQFHEYIWLLETAGRVIDVIYHRKTVVTIVARRKL
jgi:SAM-dependent methyltransferase